VRICDPSHDGTVGKHLRTDPAEQADLERVSRHAGGHETGPGRHEAPEPLEAAFVHDHPQDASPAQVLQVEHAVGNAALQRLAVQAAPVSSGPTQLPDGPYVGPRKVNPKMDWFEDHQNVFMPSIFRDYGRNRRLWAPLDGFLHTYLVTNEQTETGLSLSAPALNQAAFAIIGQQAPAKVPDIRGRRTQRERDSALLDAVLAAFDAAYRPAYQACHDDWLRSSFRLYHEWAAVRFGMVQKPYAWWRRTS
jgi:hypothetical protein